MFVASSLRPRHRLVNGTKKMLLRVILSNTKFPFYCLLRTAATSMAQQPLCSAALRLLYPLPPSSATFQRLVPIPSLPFPLLDAVASPLRCRSLHFDQSDAIQLITFNTECLSRSRRRREPLRCLSSGTQRAPGTDASGRHTSNSAALYRCSPLIPSVRVRPSDRRCSLPDYGPFSARS